MTKIKDEFIFRPEWFEAYGLDKEKNFLMSPTCGCGGKASILLRDFDELSKFAMSVLSENECCHCAVFVHFMNNEMYVFFKVLDNDDNICYYSGQSQENDMESFKKVDEEFGFHCYGLMIEHQKGQWRIVDE
jgi:hypothetical protein